ncbi:RNase adapter RapZ [Sphingomonas flavalba]|uniref:RNase adapter RapZ n=1 Tax=Sphingomonas flavalba TaxID=2559804 RepID=UPI00109DFBEB|nr:RNase adapter RapZ [Sphingomonas flavalba]
MTTPKRILLITGMSGAGKSTALDTLEDMGWEVVDNLPLTLLDRLLRTPPAEGSDEGRPLAVGLDSRTRGFAADGIIRRIQVLRDDPLYEITTLFLDCSGAELERRYSETRRRHPMALDRPAADGIARERELLAPLRRDFGVILDTTGFSRNDLQHDIRARFSGEKGATTTLLIQSFGFARGLPRNADLVFDMRFLRNPHWDRELRPLTGLDGDVATYVAEDPAYAQAVAQIESLLLLLLPRYALEGKSYVSVAFGCTGGRHRSVHVAERVAATLRAAGFSPTVQHRDLATPPKDTIEDRRNGRP